MWESMATEKFSEMRSCVSNVQNITNYIRLLFTSLPRTNGLSHTLTGRFLSDINIFDSSKHILYELIIRLFPGAVDIYSCTFVWSSYRLLDFIKISLLLYFRKGFFFFFCCCSMLFHFLSWYLTSRPSPQAKMYSPFEYRSNWTNLHSWY